DPALGLPIPEDIEPLLSERDTRALTLEEAAGRGLLPSYEQSLKLEAALSAGAEPRATGRTA
ncbi:dTDP-4-keto-6-deoxy-D-glucose epimerase, partial [Streptomyces sp. SID7499]|nr:dTDP-4-keto-6-deoxy-D-glucose epimerase [Streptomyces sp. SID7499]